MPTPRRAVALAVLGWVGAATIAGSVAWRAVAVVDTDSRIGVLSQSQVASALAESTSTPGPTSVFATDAPQPTEPPQSPEPTATPTAPQPAPTTPSSPAPAPPSSAPPTTARTWPVTGGTVTASCTGSHISGYATPQDGWTVELISAGPVRLEVELHREHHETHLIATCEDGVPVAETRTSDGEHDDDHHDDGHD